MTPIPPTTGGTGLVESAFYEKIGMLDRQEREMPEKVCGFGLECRLMLQEGISPAICPNWRKCGAFLTLNDDELEQSGVNAIAGKCRDVVFLKEIAFWYTLRFRLTVAQGVRILEADHAPIPVSATYRRADRLYILLVNYPWYFLWMKPDPVEN